MKIKLRFTIHFIIGLLLCLFSMGLTAMLSIEFLLPALGINENQRYYDLFVILTFFIHLILCSAAFSIYFVRPLLFMMNWISNLTQGIYEPPGTKNKVYNKNNRLRKPFWLYEEVITDIHLLSDTLKKSASERTQLEENKRSWIAGISHDLKTPLTYVIGYSALLLNEEYVWSPDEITGFLREIQLKGQYIGDLIEDLNVSAQMEDTQSQIPLRLEEINIADFVQRLIAEVANDPGSDGYELSFQTEEEYILIPVDQKLIYRALMNLLVNTIKHNPPGTSIHIDVTRLPEQSVHIKVSDNGVGMDQSTLDNLFRERNNTHKGKSVNTHSGLGMSIAKKLITAHNGSLAVQSKPAEGTVFDIILPATLQINENKD